MLTGWSLLFAGRSTDAQCEIHENAKLIASDASTSDQFGHAVSISADAAIVGAFKDDEAGTNSGSAYIYKRIGNLWQEETKLVGWGAGPDGAFGWSVSVNGTVAVVGAPQDTITGGGIAFVFRQTESGWVLEDTLAPLDLEPYSDFGKSVSVFGDVIIVGAPPRGTVCCPTRHGAAYVYGFDGTTWTLRQKLTSGDTTDTVEGFGSSLSIHGDYCIIGAPEDPPNYAGAAFIFRNDGTSWMLDAELSAFDELSQDRFGTSVSIDSTQSRAIVGAPGKDDVVDAGAAYVYRRSVNGWAHEAKLVPQLQNFDDSFGKSVSLQENLAAIGAYGHNGFVGAAYVFRHDGLAWIEATKLLPSEPSPLGTFGVAIGIDGGSVIVGAEYFDAPSVDSGAAYIFDFLDCNTNGIPDECDIADCVGDLACGDCNANSIPDECDIADCPPESYACQDCDADGVMNGCEEPGEYCETNADCDDGLVCTGDECDPADCTCLYVVSDPCCEPTGACPCSIGCENWGYCCDLKTDTCQPPPCEGDCNGNGILDEIDIDSGFSEDCNHNGMPDECEPVLPATPIVDPFAVNKSRFVSVSIPPLPSGSQQALRVTLKRMHRVVPPYTAALTVQFPQFEYGPNCDEGPTGCVRWVGPPQQYAESSTTPQQTFRAAALQCTLHYQDWSTVGLVHVTGSEIIPSSRYDVQMLDGSCQGIEETCEAISCALEIDTTRWGDVVAQFNPPSPTVQPDVADISALVDKFRSAPGAPIKARGLLAGEPGNPFGEITPAVLNVDFGFSHISMCVDAFRGMAYPYTPRSCP